MATLGIGTFFVLKKQMPLIFGKAFNNLLPKLYFSAFDISVTPAFRRIFKPHSFQHFVQKDRSTFFKPVVHKKTPFLKTIGRCRKTELP
jgi:hypothetical protein